MPGNKRWSSGMNQQGKREKSEINLLEETEQEPRKIYNEKKCRNVSLQILFVACLILLATTCYVLRPLNICFDEDGNKGYCLDLFKCPFTVNEIKQGKQPVMCKTDKDLEVCCVDTDVSLTVPVLNPRYKENPIGKKTTENNHRSIFYDTKQTPALTSRCDPNYKPPEVGRISHQKCLEYQKKYVFPCEDSYMPNGGMVRVSKCNRYIPEGLITGGNNASRGEFPHMALLGYNSTNDEWQCDGIIVSERFIMTAGHCTYSVDGGYVQKVRIGAWKKSDPFKTKNIYRVKKIHKYPLYKPPLDYNDIALLEIEKPMKLNQYAVPACLHDGIPINDTVIIATGWGADQAENMHKPDVLQKVELERYSDEKCKSIYVPSYVRNMPTGYDNETQICYGGMKSNKDTCWGDSGGPAQIEHPTVECMHLVMAVISNGKYCGVAGSPGIYTKVSAYLDWIESIVWP